MIKYTMNHRTIVYMWNFKPNERNSIPMDCIRKNKMFTPEYSIVTPNDIIPILSSFDGLSELWAKIPDKYWIVKADLGRLLYIYKHGGFYLDVDCIMKSNPFNSINPKCDRMILFTEFIVSVDKLGMRECKHPRNAVRIANFAFASNFKRHPFLESCIRECIRRLTILFDDTNTEKWEETDILWVCGLDVITTMYHAQFGDDGSHADVDSSIRLIETGCLIHLGYGSWRDK